MKKLIILLFIVLINVGTLHATSLQREYDKVENIDAEFNSQVDLGDVVVTTTRIKDYAKEKQSYAGSINVITAQDIEDTTTNNIADAIGRTEGVLITDFSGFGLGSGNGAVVNLRGVGGGGKTSALVTLNGVKINQLVDDAVLLKAFPVSDIARVEVLKGGTSGVAYGDGALSGVVNIITEDPTKEKQTKVETSIGSFGQFNNLLAVSGTQEDLGYVVTLNKEFNDGYRENSAYDGKSGSAKLVWDNKENSRIELYMLSHEDETEAPGSLSELQAKEDRRQAGDFKGKYWNEYHHFSLSYDRQLTENISYNILGYRTQRYSDSDFGWGYYEITEPSIGANANVKINKEWGNKSNVVIIGTEIREQEASTGPKNSGHSHSKVNGSAFYVQDTFSVNDKLFFDTGYRYDRAIYDESLTWPSFEGELEFEGHSPAVGARYKFNDISSVFANYSRRFKMPAIYDLDAVTPEYNDNVNVDPQISDNYEAGINYRPSKYFDSQLVYFILNTNDEIMYDPFNFKNSNFDTKRNGIEGKTFSEITDKFGFGVNAAYMNAEFDGSAFNNNSLPMTPKEKYGLELKYKFDDNWIFSFDWNFIRDFYRANDFNNNFKADNYDVCNLKLIYKNKDFYSYIYFNNIFNKKYSTYQSSSGFSIDNGEYPMPGFNVLWGVGYIF